ncbi:unannotated protein [freshwater metagenome]|uniref:Unannotated protein n=1 Tax=freshwater metagenome TaxID=449393 RepID=A0A6J7B5V2_9ZZZZ
MKSAPARSPQRRSSISFSDIAGTETATPGRFIPLLLLTAPGSMTLVITSLPLTSTTCTVTFPSSINMRSPALQSPGSPLYVVPTRSFVPSTSSVVIVKISPRANSCGPSINLASRIFGPCKSTRIATGRPASFAAART